MISAARHGDIATVRKLLTENHVDVNITDEVKVCRLSMSYSAAIDGHQCHPGKDLGGHEFSEYQCSDPI